MRVWMALMGALGLMACEPVEQTGGAGRAFAPQYGGIETRLLDGDLVNFNVTMFGARNGEDVSRYAECAAAQYTLIRGYGFARHLRTSVEEDAGLWNADAVYTISSALPDGLRTIDAEVTVAACTENGIPTV
jgi:hypothetical protein